MIIARLATGLKKLPDEIRTMSFRDARRIFDYWHEFPPEHELMAIVAAAHGWAGPQPRSQEEADRLHRDSLEKRWAAGAMSPKQMFEAGGTLRADGAVTAAGGQRQLPQWFLDLQAKKREVSDGRQ